ncbi:30S ribosomal protein S6--L-glutamate ligase, partial [Escherichia coli]|nr:30S ribosomal protein S6--L-glutamate ligase [Escherichia coli]
KLVEARKGSKRRAGGTRQAAESVIDAFRGLNRIFWCRNIIRGYQGYDIRCLVVGDEVVAAIEPAGERGRFSFQFASWRRGKLASITPQEREIAITAARTMALDVAGVDILRANPGRW